MSSTVLHSVVEIDIHNWDAEVAQAEREMQAAKDADGQDRVIEFRPVDRSPKASIPRDEYRQSHDGVWMSGLPCMNACCDCGLVHNYEYKIVAVDLTDAVAVGAASRLWQLLTDGRIRMDSRSFMNPQATTTVRTTREHTYQPCKEGVAAT